MSLSSNAKQKCYARWRVKLSPPVKHLLVDLDGTLLGNKAFPLSVEFVRQAMAALKPYGGWRKAAKTLLAINKEFTRPVPGRPNDVRIVELFSERLGLDSAEGRKVLKEGVLKIFPGLERHFYPLPGAKEFLGWAKDHFPLTLATNPVWPVEVIELRVKWAGLDPTIFKSITHIRQMHACKPAPEYYEQILEQEGLKAEECLLIGNDVRMDLPATRVGIRVFIVGKFTKVEPLKLARAKAPAWKGPYPLLRQALEKQLSS